MDQTLVSNQVFDKIQEPTESHSILNGTIIYANKYSGLSEVPMPQDWVDHLDAQGGGIGNNPLIQLEAKLKDMADGPWYIDDRDGILYIHNKDFQADSVHTYVYQQENGEVISVSFSTQSQNGIKTYQSTGMFGSKSLGINMGGYFGSNYMGTSGSNSSTHGSYGRASLPEQIVLPTPQQSTNRRVTSSTDEAKKMASLGYSIRGYASVDKQIEWQLSRFKQTSTWSNLVARGVQQRLREIHKSWEDIDNLLVEYHQNGASYYAFPKYYHEFYNGIINLLGREPIEVDVNYTVYQYEQRKLFGLRPQHSRAQAISSLKRNSTYLKNIENELNKIEYDENSKGIYLAHDHTWNVTKDRSGRWYVYTDVLHKRVIKRTIRIYDGVTYHSTAIVHMWNYFHRKNRPKTNRK